MSSFKEYSKKNKNLLISLLSSPVLSELFDFNYLQHQFYDNSSSLSGHFYTLRVLKKIFSLGSAIFTLSSFTEENLCNRILKYTAAPAWGKIKLILKAENNGFD